MKWFREIFEKDSQISSKRVLGAMLILWVIGAATFFIVFKGRQTSDGLALIQFLATTGVGLVAAGIVEKFKKGTNDGNTKGSS